MAALKASSMDERWVEMKVVLKAAVMVDEMV